MQFVPLQPAQLQEARPKEASTTLPKIDLPVKTHLFDHRRTGKLRLLSEGGKILAHGSCLDVEYRSAKEFETAVLSEQSLWEEAFAMESLSRNHSHKEPMTSAEAVFAKYKAKQDLQMFLSTVRLNKKQHDAYTLRYTLRPCAAQQINCNNARIAALGDAYVGTLRDELQQENDDLLDNPQSWIATDLRVREHAQRTRYVGSDIVLVLQKSLSYKVERETLSSWKSSYRALHQRESGLLDQYHSHFKQTNANQY